MYDTPTPDELRAFMQSNNLTGVDIAALTGVHPRTARRWVQPPEAKGAKPIPWSDWILILLLTGKKSVDDVIKMINQWKTQKEGRGLYERGIGGRPVKENE